ncbi:hypothetical protein CLV58_1133 [Spirosoma oryzae]|uniref:Uncharacterized protein n=1 Tax=Spirosoma oryzae TaxID=1469603 RepID=A0A2T0SR47_9BACT|nr:hypothetical protein [Spirosoma oryzae]PRY35876.1 hypothetical protein CLV58_1133 [Spirosoma oryzae]
MITVHIDDAQLEQRINEEVNATGKSVQLVIEELLSAALPTLEYPHLNPTEHGHIIADSLDTSNEQSENTTLFSQVSNAADYVSNLRKTSWRR